MEAQTTWSENIVLRLLDYLTGTWDTWMHATGQLVYRSRKVEIPKPELYVPFPGRSGPKEIHLADTFFDGDRSVVDCTVRCIYEWPGDGILAQYIRCTEICDDAIRKWGRSTSMAVQEIRRRCVHDGVLAEYMQELGDELVRIVEFQTEAEIQEQLIADSRDEGIQLGRDEGMKIAIRRMAESGVFTVSQIAASMNMSTEYIRKILGSPAY